jgi:hypothetical protein
MYRTIDLDSFSQVLSKRHPSLELLVNKIGRLNYQIPLFNSIHDAVLYAVIGQMLSNSATTSIGYSSDSGQSFLVDSGRLFRANPDT